MYLAKCVIFVFSLTLLLLIFDTWHSNFGWWNQQRLYQIIILLLAALIAGFSSSLFKLYHRAAIGLLLLLFFGLIASTQAIYPYYAIKEWGLYAALIILTLLLSSTLSRQNSSSLTPLASQHILLYVLAIAAFLNAYQFMVYYAMAFITKLYVLDANLLFSGFSNPRFLNQFQGLLIPVLSYLTLVQWQSTRRYSRLFSIILFTTLMVHWCIAFTLGGRSLWVGLFVAHLMLCCFFRTFWRLLALQLLAMLVGGLLFYIMFYAIPEHLQLSSHVRDTLRTTSSGRIELWQKTWQVYLQSPWLGVGPMHLAAEPHLRFASPHQNVLQLLAEWGPLAAITAVYLATKGMLHGLNVLRSPQANHLDAALWLSIGTALVMAQFEGVFNAPYTQLWLAVLIATALVRWTPPQPKDSKSVAIQSIAWRTLALVTVIIHATVLLYEVPTLLEDSQAHMEKHKTGYVPRYCSQGWIPMDP